MSLVSIQEHVYDQTKKKAEHKGNWTSKQIENLCKFLKLSLAEEKLLAMIDNLDNDAPFYCYASNKYLGENLRLSESRVSFYITKLKRKGLIEQVEREGRRRTLRCLRENWIVDSKKELCVKTSTIPASIHDPELRESAIHIIKDNTKEEYIRSSSKPSSTQEPLTPKKEAMNPIDERPSTNDDACGADDLNKSFSSSSPSATGSTDIVVTKTNGKELRVTESELYMYFSQYPQFSSEEVQQAVTKFRTLPNPINNVLGYLKSMCETAQKERLNSAKKNNKTKTPKPDYTNLYPEPVPHKNLISMGELMKMTEEELEQFKKKNGIK